MSAVLQPPTTVSYVATLGYTAFNALLERYVLAYTSASTVIQLWSLLAFGVLSYRLTLLSYSGTIHSCRD